MTPERFNRIKQTLTRRQTDLSVLTDNVHKPHNISAILRTCDAVGIHQIHSVIPGGIYKLPARAAMGSTKWVQFVEHESLEGAFKDLKSNGCQIVAAHWSERAIDFREVDYTKPTVILMGAEKEGVSDYSAENADEHITIPMLGMVASFNVSVAAAIIMAEAQRQRQNKGMYDQRSLEDEQYYPLLFEWTQPKVAELCRKKNIAYPPLTEDGDIHPDYWPLKEN